MRDVRSINIFNQMWLASGEREIDEFLRMRGHWMRTSARGDTVDHDYADCTLAVEACFGHKQTVIDMLAAWARDIAPQIGRTKDGPHAHQLDRA
jgi:hypothetical protein